MKHRPPCNRCPHFANRVCYILAKVVTGLAEMCDTGYASFRKEYQHKYHKKYRGRSCAEDTTTRSA